MGLRVVKEEVAVQIYGTDKCRPLYQSFLLLICPSMMYPIEVQREAGLQSALSVRSCTSPILTLTVGVYTSLHWENYGEAGQAPRIGKVLRTRFIMTMISMSWCIESFEVCLPRSLFPLTSPIYSPISTVRLLPSTAQVSLMRPAEQTKHYS